MGKYYKSLCAVACLGIAVSVLAITGCASHSNSSQTTADRQLATDVAKNLNRAADTTFPNVAVKANAGQVQLKGFVATEAQRAEAARIASQVPGVRQVDNELAVSPGNPPMGGATVPGDTQYPHY